MKPIRLLLLPITLVLPALGSALVAAPVGAATGDIAETVTATIEPTETSVILGDSLDLSVTVTNNGADPTGPLVVHLDITDPGQSSSVDPEDWTSTLTKPVGIIQPGDSVAVDWTVQPISGGTFSTYAVILGRGIDSISASNVLQVDVADRRSLNPNGILPVAIGAPAVVGALLLLQIRQSRRTARAPLSPATA